MKGFSIYNPKGSAAEYAKWAANFYTGCTCGCSYCYNRKGLLKSKLGGDTIQLKKMIAADPHGIFLRELKANQAEIKKTGLFMSFVSDPFLPETSDMTQWAIEVCLLNFISPVLLTKQTAWVDDFIANKHIFSGIEHEIAIGFTLTGFDQEEPGAATNADRIKAMQKLKQNGFTTWASIEPVLSIKQSEEMIGQSIDFCDHYKIGTLTKSPFIGYTPDQVFEFYHRLSQRFESAMKPVYWKNSLLRFIMINRDEITYRTSVSSDFNIFTQAIKNCPDCGIGIHNKLFYNNASPADGHTWECTTCKVPNNFV